MEDELNKGDGVVGQKDGVGRGMRGCFRLFTESVTGRDYDGAEGNGRGGWQDKHRYKIRKARTMLCGPPPNGLAGVS